MTDLPGPIAGWFAARGWQVRAAPARDARGRARGPAARCWSRRPARARRWPAFCRRLAELVEQPERRAAHALHLAAEGAGGRRAAQPARLRSQEMGLPIRVETRTGDTPADRKARQRVRPPQILLTTPESLSLLLSHEDSFTLFAGLKHRGGRRDPRLRHRQARRSARACRSPGCRRSRPDCAGSALSATVADPEAYRGWLAPHGDAETVDAGRGRSGRRAEDRDPAARGRARPLVGP